MQPFLTIKEAKKEHPYPGFVKFYFKNIMRGKHWDNRTNLWWIIMILLVPGFVFVSLDKKWSIYFFIPLTLMIIYGFIAGKTRDSINQKRAKSMGISWIEYNIRFTTSETYE